MDYVAPTYLTTLTALIAPAAPTTSHGSARRWAGCSASWPRRCPARRSSGSSSMTPARCSIPRRSRRIGQYFGTDPAVRVVRRVEDLRAGRSRAPFGPLTDAQWEHRDANQRAPARRWPLGRRLRPRHRRALPRAARPPRPLAAVGRDPLPDARAARRAIRPAVERDGARDERARPAAARRRVRRRRPRADAACTAIRSIPSSSSSVAVRTPRTYNRRGPRSGAHHGPHVAPSCRSRCDCRPCPNDPATAPRRARRASPRGSPKR